MMRRLTARSIVIAGIVTILGMLQYLYGTESVDLYELGPLRLSTLTSVLPETTEPIRLEGNLRSGFHAGRYYHIKAKDAKVQGLHFYYDFKHLTLYMGHQEIPREGVVVTVGQDLPIFLQKDTSAGHEALHYAVAAARVPVVTADHLEMPPSEALVRATWTEQKDERNWRLELRGAPGQSGKVNIVVPASLLVFSDASLPFAIPMIVSLASSSTHADDFRTCLESAFSTARVYVPPSDATASNPFDSAVPRMTARLSWTYRVTVLS